MFNTSTLFFLIFNLSILIQCQAQDNEAEFKKTFNNLSYGDVDYKLNYSENKAELYFETIVSGKINYGYKLLIKDIHPKGIYLYEDGKKYIVRVISINNGNVFIEEDFTGKYRRSNTTNYIEIDIWDETYKPNLVKFIREFEKFVDNKTSKKNDDEEDIQIILPTKKN